MEAILDLRKRFLKLHYKIKTKLEKNMIMGRDRVKG